MSTLYSFVLSEDASSTFEIERIVDSEGRIFGALKVKAGAAILTNAGTSYPLSVDMVLLSDTSSVVSSCDLEVLIVTSTSLKLILPKLRDFAVKDDHTWGRNELSDSSLLQQLEHIESNSGELKDRDIYHWEPEEKRNSGNLYSEWVGATEDIGGLAWRYAGSPAHWKDLERLDSELEPLDAGLKERVKQALYAAIPKLAAALLVDVTDVYEESEYESVVDPVEQAAYDKTLLGEAFAAYGEWNDLSHNAVTHQWEFTDALSLAAVYLAEDLAAETMAGDSAARAATDGLVELMHVQFCLTGDRRVIDNPDVRGKWGLLHDVHSQGVWTDANLAHRLRTWVGIMAAWQDYNRPVTYVPYWYEDFDHSLFLWKNSDMAEVEADFKLVPDFTPDGVLGDVKDILGAGYVRPRMKQFSGFLPDGFISHHQDYCQDAAMLAYGFEWLRDPVLVAHTVAGTPFSFSGGSFEVPAKWLAYSYNKIMFKGHIDWAFLGREYHVEELNLFWRNEIQPIARMLADDHGDSLEAELLAELEAMAAEPEAGPAGEVNGNTAFYNSDSMVHRDNGWYMSVRFRSLRAQGNEDFESPRKSFHMGAGMLKTLVHGDEYDYVRARMDDAGYVIARIVEALAVEENRDRVGNQRGGGGGGIPHMVLLRSGRVCVGSMKRSKESDSEEGF